MNPISSITGITIPGASALRIDTSFAGKVFTPIGGKPGVRTIQYLYGPGRTDARPNVPNSAYLPSSKLPDKLMPGAYSLHIRNEGESHYTYIDIEVVAAPTTQPQQPTPPAGSTPTPTPTPTPSSTGGGNVPAAIKKYGWGFVASDKDDFNTLKSALIRAKADGATWVRIWHTGFGTLSAENIAIIKLAKSLGYIVVVCQNVKDGEARNLGNPDTAGFVAKNRAILASIDYVEAGNELNLNQYRPDDLGSNWQASYVTRWLSPLYAALKGVGPKVLVCSITDVGTTGTRSA